MRIDGSNVLLTGATGGLGQAIAHALAAKNANLLLTGRRAEVLEPLAAELPSARALAVDLGDPSEVQRLLDQAGEVDILIANAGLSAAGKLDSFSLEQIQKAIEVNLGVPIALAHALAPAMVARKSGHLLFMSSLAGKAATAGSSIYNGTKFGLRGFALALRAELRRSDVGVSVVLPGFIREAGMFADSGAKLPPGVGTRTPKHVADAVVSAIERNRGEVEVAPPLLRIASNFSHIAPELASRGARIAGADKVASSIADGQRGNR